MAGNVGDAPPKRTLRICVGRRGGVVSRAALQIALGTGELALSRVLERLTIVEQATYSVRGARGYAPPPKRIYAFRNDVGTCPQTARPGQSRLVFPVAKVPTLCALVEMAGLVTPVVVESAPDDPSFGDLAPLGPSVAPGAAFPPLIPLYGYQTAIAANLVARLGPGTSAAPASAYLEMDTGLGKTFTALATLAPLGPILFVVPTQPLADQTLEEASVLFGPGFRTAQFTNVGARAREAWLGKTAAAAAAGKRTRGREPAVPPTPQTHDLVVIVINTAREKEPAFFEGWGSVVLDEAHELCSNRNAKVLWVTAGVPRRLGLSATPLERDDGFDALVAKHLGEPLDAAELAAAGGAPFEDLTFRGEVREVGFTAAPRMNDQPPLEVINARGTLSAIKTVANLAADPHRTRLVAAETARLFSAHLDPALAAHYGLVREGGEPHKMHIFVFSELREYLDRIAIALRVLIGADNVWVPQLDELEAADRGEAVAARADPLPEHEAVRAGELAAVGGAAAILRGGAADATRTRARDDCRVTLMTYGYGRRGISFKKYSAIVAATPRRKTWKQVSGRILRRGGDERVLRVIVDVVDTAVRLKTQVYERRKVFQARGFEIRRVDVRAAQFARDGAAAVDAGPAAGKLIAGRPAARPAA